VAKVPEIGLSEGKNEGNRNSNPTYDNENNLNIRSIGPFQVNNA